MLSFDTQVNYRKVHNEKTYTFNESIERLFSIEFSVTQHFILLLKFLIDKYIALYT